MKGFDNMKKGLLVAVATVVVSGLGAAVTKAILEHRRHKQKVLEFAGDSDLAEDVPEEVVEEILNEEEVMNTEK